MARIPQVGERTTAQAAAEAEELRLRGRMTNMKRTLLHSPVALRVYGEWFALRDELRPVLGDRAIWIFAHAISKAAGSPIGTGFMRRALVQLGLNPDALPLTPDEATLVRFGEAISTRPKAIPADIWPALEERYGPKTLVDLVAFAGLMVATNLFNDLVEVELDEELKSFNPL